MKGYSYEITLDINESQSPITLPIKVGDRNRKVCISLRKGSEPYVLEKGTLAYVTAKQSGETYGVLCGVINGKIFCDFSALVKPVDESSLPDGVLSEGKYKSIVNTAGIYDCELVVYRSEDSIETLITASRFTLVVDPRLSNEEEVEFIGYPYEDFAEQVSEYLNDYDKILFKDDDTVMFKNAVLQSINDSTDNEPHFVYSVNALNKDIIAPYKEEIKQIKEAISENAIKTITAPSIWKLEPGVYYVSGNVLYAIPDPPLNPNTIMVNGTGVLIVAVDALANNTKHFYLYANGKIYFGHSVLVGTFDDVEIVNGAVSGEFSKVTNTITAEKPDEIPNTEAVINYVDTAIGGIENGSY